MNNSKIAIIGCGRMGRRHLMAIQKLGFSVFGLVDPKKEMLEAACKEGNISADLCFLTSSDMYCRGIPDALVVSTTADSHFFYVTEGIRKGVGRILVEKPMAVSVEQCLEMIDLCQKNGSKLAVNHQIRFMDQYCDIKGRIESDKFGGFTAMSVMAGNMGIAMNAGHFIEALRFFSGSGIKSISAWLSNDAIANPRGPQFQDRGGCIRATTHNAKRLYIDASVDQFHGLILTVFGKYGYLILDLLTGKLIINHRKEENRHLQSTRYDTTSVEYFESTEPVELVNSSSKMLKSLMFDDSYMTGWEGLEIVRSLVAAHESSDKGGIPIDPSHLIRTDETFAWA